jgi:hypothetical protein
LNTLEIRTLQDQHAVAIAAQAVPCFKTQGEIVAGFLATNPAHHSLPIHKKSHAIALSPSSITFELRAFFPETSRYPLIMALAASDVPITHRQRVPSDTRVIAGAGSAELAHAYRHHSLSFSPEIHLSAESLT